jgi:hypothetical protein
MSVPQHGLDRARWYAEGLRWIGSLFLGAADHFEQAAARMAAIDPRVRREAENYLDGVRTRAHLQG